MYKFLKVVGISEVKQSPKGLRYVVASFRPFSVLPSGQEIFSNEKEKSRTLFGAHDNFKADPLFDEITAKKIVNGALVEGSINRYDTTEYQPEGFDRPINTYTTVVFSNEDGVKYANRQLKDNFACVIDLASGALTAPEQLERPLSAPVKRLSEALDHN